MRRDHMLNIDNSIENLLKMIEEADAIVVGGAAGMSSAAGYNLYATDERFYKYFGNPESINSINRNAFKCDLWSNFYKSTI